MGNVVGIQYKDKIHQQADALEELRRMHSDHEMLQAQAAQYRHTIGQLQFRVEFLTDQVYTSQQNERVAMRKLVRLAGAMKNMSVLAKEAEIIMASVQDWHDDETEEQAKAEHASAAAAVAALPASDHAEVDEKIPE